MDSSRLYHHLNLLPQSATNFIDPRLVSAKSPFRFFGSGGGGGNGKTTDDERLALLDRFRLEGLDVRKLNDAQKLPFVWRWLGDAEINCQSLRHQIEKMRLQHDEELQEVEDYIEQVWKLSTERLILLEEENKCLRHSAVASSVAANRRYSKDNNNLDDQTTNTSALDFDEEEGEDSDIELEKCLYGGGGNGSANHKKRQQAAQRAAQQQQHQNGRPGSGAGGMLYPASNRVNNLVNSSSVSSLGSSISVSTGLNNLCDSLKMRSSRSCWQLGSSSTTCPAPTNGNGDGDASTLLSETDQHNNKRADLVKTPTNGYCEKCEMLDADLMDMRQKCAELEGALDDTNEKNFVLEKLNRSIEMENENFAYKLAEAEDRSNQLERRILLLDKECRHLKASLSSSSPSLVDTASSSTSGLGTATSSGHHHHAHLHHHHNSAIKHLVPSPSDQRRLVEELNHKVKTLEETLDHRLQLYEELEIKYEKQKEKQNETLWKLRKFMHDKEPTNGGAAESGSNLYADLLVLQQEHDDQTHQTTTRVSSTADTSSGLLTMDPLGPVVGQHYRPPLHRNSSVHLV